LAIEIGVDWGFPAFALPHWPLAARFVLSPSLVLTNRKWPFGPYVLAVTSPLGTGVVTGFTLIPVTPGTAFPFGYFVGTDH
jgi:hypothetical protein